MLGRRALECLQGGGGDGEPPCWVPHTPHPKQQMFLEQLGREVGYGGAMGGGKSDALLMAALQYVDVAGYDAIIFRKTFSDLKLPGALIDRSHEWLSGTPARWNGQDHCWTFPSGAKLTFGYMDGPHDHERYKSTEFSFIGVDQLEQFLERQYLFLCSRLRAPESVSVPWRLRTSFNPGDIGHDWVKKRFGIPDEVDFTRIYKNKGVDQKKQEFEVTFVPASLKDNPSMPEAYEDNLAMLDAVTYQQMRFGKWIRDASGLVYRGFSEDNLCDELPELPDEEEWVRVLGCDFGVTSPTAYVQLAFTEHDPRVYVERSEQWTNLAPSDASDIAKRWEREAGGYDAIVGDIGGLGKGFEAEWAKRYHWMRKAEKGDKLGNIKLINGDFEKRRVMVLPGNSQLVTDLRALPWKDEQCLKEYPGMPNHLPDALLYGWREARHWDWEERPPPEPKGVDLAAKQMAERKERVKERIKKQREESQEESWDWSEDNGKQWDPWAD